MTTLSARTPIDVLAGTGRTGTGLLALLHLPFVVGIAIYLLTGVGGPAKGVATLVVPAAAVALSMWHCVVVSSGSRPRGWPVTLLALAAVCYLPLPWLGWPIASVQGLFLASVLLLVPGWWRLLLCAPPALVTSALNGRSDLFATTTPVGVLNGWAFLVGLVASAGSLWACCYLIQRSRELYETRLALADAAVDRERERVSRDLHDLLGQSLTAVSLKGDLAVKLLSHDPRRARDEVSSIAELARDTLRDVRLVTHAGHRINLATEVTAARELLGAAGIDVELDTDLGSGTLPDEIESVAAWAIREGATNLLRHSNARSCAIRVRIRADGGDRLEVLISNDGVAAGADRPETAGTGLTGLRARAALVGGTVAATVEDGRFCLAVRLPLDAS